MSSTQSLDRDAHVDTESLGVYLEGRSTADERAAVEAHLATCADCCELFADCAEALSDDLPQGGSRDRDLPARDRGSTVLPRAANLPTRPRSKWMAALAAAAVLAWLTWFGIERFRPAPRETPEFEALAAAMRDGRPVRGRLAGELPYGPAPSPVRTGNNSASRSARLETAAARVESRLQGDPRPEALHAVAVALLAAGRLEDAVAAFASASAREPASASIHNDLAAAYLERALLTSAPADLERALAASDHALAVSPGMPEALFNRALVLERLGHAEQARAAWQAYLAADASSEWAQEARRRMALLQTK